MAGSVGGVDDYRAGAGGGVAPGVGSHVVDGVGRRLRGVDVRSR